MHHYQELKDMDNVQAVLPDEEILANISAAVKDYGIARVAEIIGFEQFVEALGVERIVEALGRVEKVRKILDTLEKKSSSKQRVKKKGA